MDTHWARLALTTSLAAVVAAVSLAMPVAAADRDHDGLRDAWEAKYGVTSPNLKDSDWDGVVDSAEDNDNDRLGNLGEQRFGTDPGVRDTDGDGVPDGAEDHDRDGRLNAAEQDQRPVPGGLVPSLSRARFDGLTTTKGCDAGFGKSSLKRCTFGPTGTGRRIVLMGDSHAMMIADAFAKVAKTDRFRLITMLKGGCVPFPGAMNLGQWKHDRGKSCRNWRLNAIKALKASPPDLLVITASEYYGLVDGNGHTIPKSQRPAVWRRGVEDLLERLPAKTDVLLLGDVPRNWRQPAQCLRKNPRDMSRCTSRRKSVSERPVSHIYKAQAQKPDVHFATLFGQICSYDPCPLVQGKTLLWRDRGHLTGTFARKLTPSVRKILRRRLRDTHGHSLGTAGPDHITGCRRGGVRWPCPSLLPTATTTACATAGRRSTG